PVAQWSRAGMYPAGLAPRCPEPKLARVGQAAERGSRPATLDRGAVLRVHRGEPSFSQALLETQTGDRPPAWIGVQTLPVGVRAIDADGSRVRERAEHLLTRLQLDGPCLHFT